MDTLFKTFSAEVKTLPESRTATFLISTASIDRDGDSIDPKGWDLTSYKSSPVVLWSHDYSSPPVAKTTKIESTTHGLQATAEFPAKGVYPFADTVYELLKGGFLNASSVGFKPTKHEKAQDREHGQNYLAQELLEWSIVPVPANPEALVQFAASKPEHKQISKSLADWSERYLNEYYGERGVYLPAMQIEKAFEAITKSGILKATTAQELSEAARIQKAAEGQAILDLIPDHMEGQLILPDVEEKEDLYLELTDETIFVDEGLVSRQVREYLERSIIETAEREVVRCLNYARGRVS